jgi:hypothetical protein
VTAAELLRTYGSIDNIYAELKAHPTKFKPGCATSLKAFEAVPWMPPGAPPLKSPLEVARSLVAIRLDVELPFADIDVPRVPKEVVSFGMDEDEELPAPTAEPTRQDVAPGVDAAQGVGAPVGNGVDPSGKAAPPADAASASGQTSLAIIEPAAAVPAEYERQLDPRSMKDAITLAKNMFDSRMFNYGTPQAVLSTVMLGRELGLPAMASLRGVHIIEGRHALSAQLMVALILKSGLAEYFEPVEFDATHAIWETKRKGARKAITMEHTIEMATTAGLVKPGSNWVKVPIDMLNSRCPSRLARMVYPDIVGGLYTPDELAELREAVA